MKIGMYVAISVLVYAVGYNSGSNQGYDNAIKFAPECRSGR